MNRREFIRNASAAGCAAVAMRAEEPAALSANPRRPNILHLQADQMAAFAIANRSGCRTPNLNRLAAEGLLFNRAYTAVAVCCPSRAMLCTGAYHWHNGVFNQVHSAPSVHRDMFPNVVNYSERLRDAGYRQGYVGKWHASFVRTPLDFGYDEIAGPNSYNPRLLKGLQVDPDKVGPRRGAQLRNVVERKMQWPGSEPFTMWGYQDGPEEATEPGWVAENGIRMLRRMAAADDKPWHIEIHLLAPHDPYMPLKSYLDRYKAADIPVPKSFADTFAGKPEFHRRESETWGNVTEDDYRQSRAHYYAYCEQLDAQIGRILDALKATGQEDNTLVAFTADHGDMVGNHRMWSKGWMPYEECYAIPLIVRWPKRIRGGQKSDALVQVHDLAHTYIDAAGAAPLSYPNEGRSLLDPAAATGKGWRDDILCAYYGGEFLYTQRIAITARHKYVFNGFGIDELYDLQDDPEEMVNRVADPGARVAVDDMRARMYELMERLGDPFGFPSTRFAMPDSQAPDRYGAPRYLPRGKRKGRPELRSMVRK